MSWKDDLEKVREILEKWDIYKEDEINLAKALAILRDNRLEETKDENNEKTN